MTASRPRERASRHGPLSRWPRLCQNAKAPLAAGLRAAAHQLIDLAAQIADFVAEGVDLAL